MIKYDCDLINVKRASNMGCGHIKFHSSDTFFFFFSIIYPSIEFQFHKNIEKKDKFRSENKFRSIVDG